MALTTNGSDSVKTRICMISDTHSFQPHPNDPSTPYRYPLPSADILLHAGDLTFVGQEAEHQSMVDMLKHANAELKIVIAGNHDITLDEPYYNEFGFRMHARTGRQNLAKIREMYCGEEARRHGIVYMDEGLRTFTLKSGARFTIYATPYQPEFCRWAFAYNRGQDRFNPSAFPYGSGFGAENPVPSYPGVDIMLTHGPPEGIRDEVMSRQRVGCEHLRRAVARARPRIHCFGHIHEGHGAERMQWDTGSSRQVLQDRGFELEHRCAYLDLSSDSGNPLRFGQETLFVNAAVVTVQYKPLNAPWLVDIDLPLSQYDEMIM